MHYPFFPYKRFATYFDIKDEKVSHAIFHTFLFQILFNCDDWKEEMLRFLNMSFISHFNII